jgi:hypothetical protein
MDQSSISSRLGDIEKKLMSLAKQERELLREQKRLRCERDHACSVMDIIYGVQIG